MGGHGGLNILPQKRWNVYNFDNREKVRKDEEAAARDEQSKREQSRKRDSELRLLKLRRDRGISPQQSPPQPPSQSSPQPPPKSSPEVVESDSKHINLFEGIKIFDPIVLEKKKDDDEEDKRKKKKAKKEEVRVVGPEDEKYRLGYGVAGKGVKTPWYMMKPTSKDYDDEVKEKERACTRSSEKKKKTVQELREERLKREKGEKERERALLMKGRTDICGSGYRDRYYRRGG